MTDPLDIDGVLSSLVSQTRTNVQTRAARTSSTGAKDQQQNMLNAFQQAFPDQDFEVTGDDTFRRIVSKKKAESAVPKASVPEGYNPRKAETGILELQTALEQATDDEERFVMATRLNSMVQMQKMYKFDEYRKTSEAQYGVPDIEKAIESIKQAELNSPFNPGNGLPSQERMAMITQLGTARTHSAARVKELMVTDPIYTKADALASGVIAEIEGRLKLSGRSFALDQKKAEKKARDIAVASVDPTQIDTIAIMRDGKLPSEDRRRHIAEQAVDNELKLSPIEKLLAGSDNEGLKTAYVTLQDPKERSLTLRVLKAKEEAIVGDPAAADRNIKLFELVMNKNLDNLNDASIPYNIRTKWKDLMLKRQTGGKSKDEQQTFQNESIAIRRELLMHEVDRAIQGDVKGWKGIIASDLTAQSVMKAHVDKDRTLDVNSFIDNYLGYNDDQNLSQKSASLHAIITSAFEALPRSAVLPVTYSGSALQEAQKLVSVRVLRNSFRGRTGEAMSDRFGPSP